SRAPRKRRFGFVLKREQPPGVLVKQRLVLGTLRWVGRAARQRPAKPYRRVRLPYPPHNSGRRLRWVRSIWAIGAAVARFPDTEEVTGSNPVSPTTEKPLVRQGFCASRERCVLARADRDAL